MTFRGHETYHHWHIAAMISNVESYYLDLQKVLDEGGTITAQTKRLISLLPDKIGGTKVTFDRVKAVVESENQERDEYAG